MQFSFRNLRLKYKFWLLNVFVLAVILVVVLYSMHLLANETQRSFMAVFRDTAPGFSAVVTVLMIVEMAVSQFLISFVEKHVNGLKHTMVEVERTGDLDKRATSDSEDEIGEMAKAFNAMQERTGTVVRSIKNAILQLKQEVDALNQTTSQSREQLVRQKSDTDRSASAVNEMLETFLEIAGSAESTRELSHRANETARNGQSLVENTSGAIEHLAEEVRGTASSVEALADNSQEIGRAVNEIQGIAEQTNLLALNAAIEAARAGEHGRGFAVVADEVRNLAQRVQDSTGQIQETIGRLLTSMEGAVAKMNQSSDSAQQCVEQANEGSNALREITAAVQAIFESNCRIAEASGAKSAATDAVHDDINGIRETTESMVNRLIESAEMGERLQGLISDLESASALVKA